MNRKPVSGILSALLLIGMLTLALNIQLGNAEAPEPPVVQWSRTYGGASSERGLLRMIQTSDGGYALVGRTRSFGAGYDDFWLVKTDALGSMQWNRTYGGASYDSGFSVVETSDGGYALTGYTFSFGAGDGDFWLVKVDSLGNMQWSKTYGGTNREYAHSVIQTSDGGYALTGFTSSFGAGWEDWWLVKVDSLGNMQWNKTYGADQSDWSAYSVVQTSDGGYAIAGSGFANLVKTDMNGNEEWSKTYGGRFFYLINTGDGGYALTGVISEDDCWLVKVDSLGNLEWKKAYGGPGTECSYSVIETIDGGYALVGCTRSLGAGGHDGWLVKVDSLGTMQWNQTYGGTSDEFLFSVVETDEGWYALAGSTDSYGAGNGDFWLMKVGPIGEMPPPELYIRRRGAHGGAVWPEWQVGAFPEEQTLYSRIMNYGERGAYVAAKFEASCAGMPTQEYWSNEAWIDAATWVADDIVPGEVVVSATFLPPGPGCFTINAKLYFRTEEMTEKVFYGEFEPIWGGEGVSRDIATKYKVTA